MRVRSPHPRPRSRQIAHADERPVETRETEVRSLLWRRTCPGGGTGRRAGLRNRCRKAWGFDSLSGHTAAIAHREEQSSRKRQEQVRVLHAARREHPAAASTSSMQLCPSVRLNRLATGVRLPTARARKGRRSPAASSKPRRSSDPRFALVTLRALRTTVSRQQRRKGKEEQ